MFPAHSAGRVTGGLTVAASVVCVVASIWFVLPVPILAGKYAANAALTPSRCLAAIDNDDSGAGHLPV